METPINMVGSTIFCEKYRRKIHEQLLPTPTMAAPIPTLRKGEQMAGYGEGANGGLNNARF